MSDVRLGRSLFSSQWQQREAEADSKVVVGPCHHFDIFGSTVVTIGFSSLNDAPRIDQTICAVITVSSHNGGAASKVVVGEGSSFPADARYFQIEPHAIRISPVGGHITVLSHGLSKEPHKKSQK